MMKTKTLNWLATCCALVASCPATADTANPLTGFYYGTATITQPASIGTIDLAFYLDVTGSAVQKATSYIDLDKTLLFPAVAPKIGGKDVGPRVSGTLSPTAFSLTSDTFPAQVSGKNVSRRLQMSNATVGDGGASIAGTFTETVTGLGKDTLTISGAFVLVKPMPVTSTSGADRNADGCLDLAEIRAGGSDPERIEFSDLSAAMNLFNYPKEKLHLGDPPSPCANGQALLQGALNTYYGAQQ